MCETPATEVSHSVELPTASPSMESFRGNLANQPVVIDNGTGLLKAGFAGGNSPRVTFRCCVGRPKHKRAMPGGALHGSDILLGRKAEEHRGALLLSYPMEHGVVRDWSDMERLWGHVYAKENLAVASEEHPVSAILNGVVGAF